MLFELSQMLFVFYSVSVTGLYPVASIEVYTPAEMFVENGTTGVLKCTFRSTQVISSLASVTWSFIPEGSSESTGETVSILFSSYVCVVLCLEL